MIADGPFAGHEWARPSVSHLRSLMRWVYEDREEAQRRAMRARQSMVQQFCPACVARIALQRLANVTRRVQEEGGRREGGEMREDEEAEGWWG